MDTDDGKINHRNIVLPVLVATAMGGISTLVGSSQQLTANGLIEEMGYSMKIFDMIPVGVIFSVVGLLYSFSSVILLEKESGVIVIGLKIARSRQQKMLTLINASSTR